MKKSLSTILSLAMAFSMFSSVAMAADAAKTSADFSDLKDLDAATKVKFDALISAGVFDGVKEGTFGLKDEMNRAQFAKVAALIFSLKVDTTLKTSSFGDVKSDDPANGYALPYIEAVKAAGITDGYAPGEYNPAGKVTKEQLAAFLIRGLGKDVAAKATPGVNDTTVSDWAKGYVAYAINQKLLVNGSDGKFGGNSNATRDLLVISSFEAKSQFKPVFNGKYAIASLKATDANVLALELNGALTADAEKALKIEVKRDGAVVSSGYTVKWDDKKTVATLTFESKFQNNKYDVAISGVSNLDDTAKTASVTTTVEKITKIDFLTASETIPLSVDKDGTTIQDVRIDFKATNQYGAQAKVSASSFDIRTSDGSIAPVAGEQAFRLTQDPRTETNNRVSITIVHEDSGVSANRTFTVGLKAQVSKIELGDLLDSSGNKTDSIDGNGGYAYLAFKAWDQYGFRVEKAKVLNDSTSVYTNDGDLEKGTSDNKRDAFIASVIGDDAAELRLFSKTDSQKDITVTVLASGSGQSASKVVKISATKEPATVEFGAYNYQLAEGDDYAALKEDEFQKVMFVPILVKDAKGNTLTPDDLVNAWRKKKFDIRSNGGIYVNPGDEIQTTGKYKGHIKIAKTDRKGSASLTVRLDDQRASNIQAVWNTTVGAARTIDNVKFSTAAKKYMTDNTDNEVKFKFYDQYGQEIKFDNNADESYRTDVTFRYTGSGAKPDGATVFQVKKNAVNELNYKYDLSTVTDGVYTIKKEYYSEPTGSQLNMTHLYDNSYRFYTSLGAKAAPYELRVELFKKGRNDTTFKSIATANTTMEVLDGTDTSNNFTYEIYADKAVNNNTILAAGKYFDLTGSSVEQATYLLSGRRGTNLLASLTDNPKGYDAASKFGKEMKVRVKKGGEEVKTNAQLDSVTSSNQGVAVAVNTKTTAAVNNKFIVAGIDAGTAKVSVVYTDLENKKKTASLDFTTKVEAPIIASIDLRRSEKAGVDRTLFKDRTIGATLVQGTGIWTNDKTGPLAEKITIKDQFGDEIVSEVNGDAFVQEHDAYLNLNYYFSDVVATEAGGDNNNASPDKYFDLEAAKQGVIRYKDGVEPTIGSPATAALKSFTFNIIAPSGASAAFTVKF